jgi:hypothetical protein
MDVRADNILVCNLGGAKLTGVGMQQHYYYYLNCVPWYIDFFRSIFVVIE